MGSAADAGLLGTSFNASQRLSALRTSSCVTLPSQVEPTDYFIGNVVVFTATRVIVADLEKEADEDSLGSSSSAGMGALRTRPR